MQQRNLLLFIGVCVVLMVGWSALTNWYWPPKVRQNVWLWKTQDPKVQSQLYARLVGSAVPDGAAPLRLAGEVALAKEFPLLAKAPAPEPPPDPWPWSRFPPYVQEQIVARLVGAAAPGTTGLDSALRLAAEAELAIVQPVLRPPAKKAADQEPITLGNESSYLKVVLSSRGGSVRSVVLNEFQAADKFGLPMWEGTGKKQRRLLELVPPYRIQDLAENEIEYDKATPFYHFNLYHYAHWEDERPLDTLEKNLWSVKEIEKGRVVQFTCDDLPDVTITKTYTLDPHDYHVGLKIGIQRKPGAQAAEKFRYQLAGAHGLPIEGEWYTYVFRNGLVGYVQNNGTFERQLEDARQIGLWEAGERVDRKQEVTIRYAAVAVQYFASAVVVAEKDQQPTGQDTFVAWARATREKPPERRPPVHHDDITVRLVSEPIELADNGAVEHQYLLYHGPVKVRLLGQLEGDKAVAPELVDRYGHTLALHTLTDHPSPGVMGSIGRYTGMTQLIIWCTNLMHWLLWVLHNIVNFTWSYGICIMILTVIVRGLMFPISRRQAQNARDMQEKMQKLSPELKKVKEKYKDDFAAMSQAQQELYKRHGINPMAQMGGCLLLFAQLPVFMGLYYCLQESIFLRLAPFLWVRNLAAPDMLVWWSESIPIVSTPADQGGFLYLGPYFNILPIVAVALMIVQQKMMTPPAMTEEDEMRNKMMKWMMVVFGVMFYKVAAGLCIYFIASSLWGLAERKLLPKSAKPGTTPQPAAEPAKPAPPKAKEESKSTNGAAQKLSDWWEDLLKKAGKQQQARRDGKKKRKKRKGKDES